MAIRSININPVENGFTVQLQSDIPHVPGEFLDSRYQMFVAKTKKELLKMIEKALNDE